MVFFHFHEPLGFLNAANDPHDIFGTRSVQYESLSEKASAFLYGLTYWGDYGGDEISRYHFDTVLENAPHLVSVVNGNHGEGLVLEHVRYAIAPDSRDEFSGEFSWLASFFRWAMTDRLDYPVFEENSFSDWEFNKIQEIIKEDVESWMKFDIRRDFDKLTNWDENAADIEDEEVLSAIDYLLEIGEQYPYFESATSIILPGIHSDDIAQRILDVRNGNAQAHQGESLF